APNWASLSRARLACEPRQPNEDGMHGGLQQSHEAQPDRALHDRNQSEHDEELVRSPGAHVRAPVNEPLIAPMVDLAAFAGLAGGPIAHCSPDQAFWILCGDCTLNEYEAA